MSKKTLLHYAAPAIITGMLFATVAVSWNEPGNNPPFGNVSAPINVSSSDQSKEGWLTIGSTSAPSMQLDVRGIAPALGSLNVTGGAILNTGGAATGLIVENGNVGIGTTSPLKTLDVAGSARVKATASSALTGTADPTASTALVGSGTAFLTELVVGDRITINAETRAVTVITDNTNLTVDTAFTDTVAASITKLPATFIAKDSSDNVDFIITENGGIGIGTNNPLAQLHLEGDSGNAAEINLIHNGVAGSAGIRFNITNDADSFFIKANNNRLIFGVGAGNVEMVMMPSGRIGVGVYDPAVELDVDGTVRAVDYYSGDGSQGLTNTVTVKGSDGNNCVLTFKDGLLTAETCP